MDKLDRVDAECFIRSKNPDELKQWSTYRNWDFYDVRRDATKFANRALKEYGESVKGQRWEHEWFDENDRGGYKKVSESFRVILIITKSNMEE